MANRFKREDVLQALCTKVGGVSDYVFTTSRPSATSKMDDFIVIRLSNGITPYADTHNYSDVQFICFVRDVQGGVENVVKEEELIDGILSIFPFNDSLISCNNTPVVLVSKSDGMGFHSTIIQAKVIIKV